MPLTQPLKRMGSLEGDQLKEKYIRAAQQVYMIAMAFEDYDEDEDDFDFGNEPGKRPTDQEEGDEEEEP